MRCFGDVQIPGRTIMTRVPLYPFRRAEQIMGMSAVKLRRWTRDEVLALIDQNVLKSPRWEVVDGELFVTPSPGWEHQRAVAVLAHGLENYCRATRAGVMCVSPSDTAPEKDVVVQPDIYVVPVAESRRLHAKRAEHTVRRLLLAVEVLSPGSERGDRGRKRALYRRTVPSYWLIDVDERRVEQWRMGETRGSVHTDRIEWRPAGSHPAFALNLKEFFARVHGEII